MTSPQCAPDEHQRAHSLSLRMSRRHWNSLWPTYGVLQGPSRCRGGEGPRKSQAAFQCKCCLFSTVKPTPEGSKSCFQDRHTEAHSATHWCNSQLPSVGPHGRGRRGSWCSTFPEQRLLPLAPACPGAGGLQVCPGNPLLRVQEVLYRSSFSTGP